MKTNFFDNWDYNSAPWWQRIIWALITWVMMAAAWWACLYVFVKIFS